MKKWDIFIGPDNGFEDLRFVGKTEKKIKKSKSPDQLFLMVLGTYMQNFNPLAQL